MEFGKLPNVDTINWKLPDDDKSSLEFLNKQNQQSQLKVYFGAPAWSHKEWIGKLYPPKTKSTEFLYHYSRNFGCIELNTSHYRIPTPEQTQKWLVQVPAEFVFCPKVFQGISHERGGLLNGSLHSEWFEFLASLSTHLGPSFMQLPPYFDYSMKAQLFHFLQSWPREYELALEFRHPTWFENGRILPALTQYLQSKRIGLVITDVAGRRDVLHTSISADFSMLRFIGNSLHPSDYTRAQDWIARLKVWQKAGLQRVYFFVHEPDDLLSPEMTDYFYKQMQCEVISISQKFSLYETPSLQLDC